MDKFRISIITFFLFQAYPLDMSQYSSLFNSTRIPMKDKDILHSSTFGKHIVVMRRGHFYKFDVLDNQGILLIYRQIF